MNQLVQEEIECFESDIIYDCHSYRRRYNSSEGRKALMEVGTGALPAIIHHLQQEVPGSFMDLDTAWGQLISDLLVKEGVEVPEDVPFVQTEAWLSMAGEFLTKKS